MNCIIISKKILLYSRIFLLYRKVCCNIKIPHPEENIFVLWHVVFYFFAIRLLQARNIFRINP